MQQPQASTAHPQEHLRQEEWAVGVAGKGALGHIASRVFYLVNKPLCLCEVSAGSGNEEGKAVAGGRERKRGREGGRGKERAACVQHLVI